MGTLVPSPGRQEGPDRFEHVTAYDDKSDPKPRREIWPPAVAGILNSPLEEDYPVLPDYTPDHGPSCSMDSRPIVP